MHLCKEKTHFYIALNFAKNIISNQQKYPTIEALKAIMSNSYEFSIMLLLTNQLQETVEYNWIYIYCLNLFETSRDKICIDNTFIQKNKNILKDLSPLSLCK